MTETLTETETERDRDREITSHRSSHSTRNLSHSRARARTRARLDLVSRASFRRGERRHGSRRVDATGQAGAIHTRSPRFFFVAVACDLFVRKRSSCVERMHAFVKRRNLEEGKGTREKEASKKKTHEGMEAKVAFMDAYHVTHRSSFLVPGRIIRLYETRITC